MPGDEVEHAGDLEERGVGHLVDPILPQRPLGVQPVLLPELVKVEQWHPALRANLAYQLVVPRAVPLILIVAVVQRLDHQQRPIDRQPAVADGVLGHLHDVEVVRLGVGGAPHPHVDVQNDNRSAFVFERDALLELPQRLRGAVLERERELLRVPVLARHVEPVLKRRRHVHESDAAEVSVCVVFAAG